MQQRSMSSYGPSSGNNNSGYRSFSGTAPVAPYAFTSTPGLTNSHSKQQTQAWSDSKNPAVRQLGPEETRLRYPVSDTSSSSSSVSSDPPSRYHQSHQQQQATAFTVRTNPNATARPVSVAALASPQVLPTATKSRPSPDRYRRKKSDGNIPSSPTVHPPAGSTVPSGSGMAAVGAHYTPVVTTGRANSPVTTSAGGVMNPIESYAGQLRSQSVDDIHTHRLPNSLTAQQRQQRRASVGAFSPGSLSMINGQVANLSNLQLPSFAPQGANQRLHGSKGSAPNIVAGRGSNDSSQSCSSHSYRPNSSPNNNNTSSPSSPTMNPVGSHEINLAHVPPRDSSQINKRLTAPSPLSKPVNMNTTSESSAPQSPQPRNGTLDPIPSTAAERLAALSADPRKGLKNRLRRAFSFGSAAELRKAAVGNSGDAAERIRLRQEKFREEQEAEQSKIAQQQEASGLGEGIYSNGQGHFFSGSTDNLSVSSTASSASIMIRKMGKGVKKSTRSLVGLFRPRSVIGVEVASPVGTVPTAAQVTMVNVEADKGKKNAVAGEAKDGLAKGTGTLDAPTEQSASATNGAPAEVVGRRGGSFVGGDRDRAEVLAAVKKGILKRQGSSSPIIKPLDNSAGCLPHVPQASSPLIESGRQSPAKHQRENSLTIEGEDYFMKSPKFAGKPAQSAPPSPSGGKGNVTFSPRITFHDTWPSGEYDRRSDAATCNRLTPAIAQQIKEELNTFKMEMDVHEESKIYTHFF